VCLVLARPKCAWQGLIKEKIDARSVSVAMPRYSGEPTGSGAVPLAVRQLSFPPGRKPQPQRGCGIPPGDSPAPSGGC